MQNSKGLSNVRTSSRLRARPGVRLMWMFGVIFFSRPAWNKIYRKPGLAGIFGVCGVRSLKKFFYFTFYFFLDYPFSCSNLVSLILVHPSCSPPYQALISCFIIKGIP